MKCQSVVTLIGLVALLWGLGNAAEDPEVLYEDEHGVQVVYTVTDTGHYTRCISPEGENYTDKRIKVWEVRLKITNGSGRRIKPDLQGIAWVSVDPHQGSALGYCYYDRVENLYRIDGHGDQSKFMFHIATLVYAIPAGRTLSNSTYLYEDQKPQITKWHFGGYRFLDDKPKTPQASARQAPAHQTHMILLLADGDDDCGGLDVVLQKLKQKNLLYRHETVGLEVSGAAQKQLQSIATQSGGNFHSATSHNLSQVFSDAVDLMRMLDMLGNFNRRDSDG